MNIIRDSLMQYMMAQKLNRKKVLLEEIDKNDWAAGYNSALFDLGNYLDDFPAMEENEQIRDLKEKLGKVNRHNMANMQRVAELEKQMLQKDAVLDLYRTLYKEMVQGVLDRRCGHDR